MFFRTCALFLILLLGGCASIDRTMETTGVEARIDEDARERIANSYAELLRTATYRHELIARAGRVSPFLPREDMVLKWAAIASGSFVLPADGQFKERGFEVMGKHFEWPGMHGTVVVGIRRPGLPWEPCFVYYVGENDDPITRIEWTWKGETFEQLSRAGTWETLNTTQKDQFVGRVKTKVLALN